MGRLSTHVLDTANGATGPRRADRAVRDRRRRAPQDRRRGHESRRPDGRAADERRPLPPRELRTPVPRRRVLPRSRRRDRGPALPRRRADPRRISPNRTATTTFRSSSRRGAIPPIGEAEDGRPDPAGPPNGRPRGAGGDEPGADRGPGLPRHHGCRGVAPALRPFHRRRTPHRRVRARRRARRLRFACRGGHPGRSRGTPRAPASVLHRRGPIAGGVSGAKRSSSSPPIAGLPGPGS